jgi:hypothetical protein
MSGTSFVYTLARVATMLAIGEDLLARIAETLQPKDGVLWILDATEDGSVGFTDLGIETIREMLDDPSTRRSSSIRAEIYSSVLYARSTPWFPSVRQASDNPVQGHCPDYRRAVNWRRSAPLPYCVTF